MRLFIIPLAIVSVLFLAGCSASPDEGSGSSPSPSPTPSAAESSETPGTDTSKNTESDSNQKTPEAELKGEEEKEGPGKTVPRPEPETPTSEISASEAFELCKADTAEDLASWGVSKPSYAPLDEATVVVRDDGYIGIYINVNDLNNSSGPKLAISCIIGDTAESPYWYTSGVTERLASASEVEDHLRLIIGI